MINILPENIAKRIAAGEVVQRPASVVKELIENSVDANARDILVNINKGGKESICIIDDGIGMDEKDARLCFERHATSKILTDEDLFKISSYGFRGEAIPSIASVSIFLLETSQKEAESGTKIVVEGGTFVSESKCPAAGGTKIEIRNLFYNTPARRKFQKTVTTEFNHILDIVNNQAIISNEVSFELIHNDKTVLKASKTSDKLKRIGDIYGKSIIDEFALVNSSNSAIEISGYISSPSFTRSNRNMQKIFINNRPVTNKTIYAAIYNAYKKILPGGRYPVVFLFIKLPFDSVDVNVHPTKDEVKFKEDSFIYESVYRLIKDSVENPSYDKNIENTDNNDNSDKTKTNESIYKYYRKPSDTFKESHPISYPRKGVSPGFKELEAVSKKIEQNKTNDQTEIQYSDIQQEMEDENIITDNVKVREIFIYRDLYVIMDIDGQLCILDQHAAHERVLYEKFKKNLSQNKCEAQNLLLPINLELLPDLSLIFQEIIPHFNKLGFEIEEFGQNAYLVRAVPAFIKENNMQEIINDMLDEIKELGFNKNTVINHFDDIIKIMACRTAYKAGDKINEIELKHIIKELFSLQEPNTCPHGRPTIIKFNPLDLEKMFRRKK